MTDSIPTPQENRFPRKVHPLMPPKERLALWRRAQAIWKQPAAEMIAEIEQSRREWDQQTPPS